MKVLLLEFVTIDTHIGVMIIGHSFGIDYFTITIMYVLHMVYPAKY